jgi:glycosyltransferase involved in cell wall biosynthesis
MPRVALFCTNFLPYSQAFVHEQLRQHQRYQAEVFAWRRFYPERFPFEPVHLAPRHYIASHRARNFERRFREAPFDVVHAHFGPGGCYALRFAERARVPLLVTFHGYEVPLLSSPTRFLPLHWPYLLKAPELFAKMRFGLCASQELHDMLLERGVSASKLRVFRLGIDVARFVAREKSSDAPLVVMIGRFVEKKGFEYGVQAFADAARGSSARLVIAGNGPREAALKSLALRLGIGAQVQFPGPLRQEQVAELLGRADVLLAPSVVGKAGNRESGLIVVKEASACEAVPIGSRHGGIPEIIDDATTGYLVPERGVAQMAERLRALLAQPELRQRLGRQGRQKMLREYDNRLRVQQLEALYDEAQTSEAHGPERR